jgi:phage terminase large subunit-like protein
MKRADFAIDWMQTNCYLYEGRGAGYPITFMPWQVDFLTRLYGWVVWSDHWRRWVRRYTQSCLWAPKKSGKSPFEAANGLYLCFAEGEPGMKCYSLAFDKAQALIAHTHAERMVEFSPILNRECKLNRSTHAILHRKSFSTYTVVSGDRHDRKGASKEGFNGSILVDETHAVTFDLMRRVKRAGISRPEPLRFECSTAGPDLEGYGFGRFQLGHKIMKSSGAGGHDNPYVPYLLHEEYMPPDGASIEDYRDEEKVKRIVISTNPSIAPADCPDDQRDKYILSIDEAMNDWREATQTSEQELRDFAMYRTNLWLSSATSWIPMHVWHLAGRSFGEGPLEQLEQLKGYPCFGGLDMSKVGDMTSMAVPFLIPLDEDRDLAEKINKWNREKATLRLKAIGAISAAETAMENSLIERMQTQMRAEAVSLNPEDLPGEDDMDGPAKNGMATDGLSLVHDGTRYIIRLVHFHWIPIKTARSLEGYVNLFKWEKWINFMPEDVINYSDISEHIEWLRKDYGLNVMAYDPAYADDVIRNLLNGTWMERELLQVDQKLSTMSPLSQDWERGIISQSLQHPRNAVLDWMNSHCELYRAASGQVKPVKPPFGNFRKIDGIVAGINALACLRHFGIANIINGYQFSAITKPTSGDSRSRDAGWTTDELGISTET